jgi:hypothetical protein
MKSGLLQPDPVLAADLVRFALELPRDKTWPIERVATLKIHC